MKHSGKFFPGWPAQSAEKRQTETTGRHVTLALMDDQPHKEHGYNPYDTIAHARDIGRRDVWRQPSGQRENPQRGNKPKRA
jgi:hypothetical protein